MNFEGNFIAIGSVDVTTIESLLANVSESDWALDIPGRSSEVANPDLQSIALVFDPDLRHSHPTRLPFLATFEPALRPVLKLVADHYESSEAGAALTRQYGLGYFIRATIDRLRAGGTARLVPEKAFSRVHSHRIHVPVVASEAVSFSVGQETRCLPVGHVFEVNNRREGMIENRGAADSMHLVLDFVLPGERCCCGSKRHPDKLCSPRACRATDELEVPCTCFPADGPG